MNWIKGIFLFFKCLNNLNYSNVFYELNDLKEKFYNSKK